MAKHLLELSLSPKDAATRPGIIRDINRQAVERGLALSARAGGGTLKILVEGDDAEEIHSLFRKVHS